MSARKRYARVLRAPHVAPLLAAAVVARMPIGIGALAIVLFLREQTGSYGRAGVVAGAFALGGALGAPAIGRLVDRFGQPRVLVPVAVGHAAGLATLVALGLLGAPLAILVLTALATGVCIPPISAVLRPLLPGLVGGDQELVTTAYALDAVLVELVFVSGPLLTAVATAVLSPVAALVLGAVLVVAGTTAFSASEPSRSWRSERRAAGHGALGALRSAGLRILVVVTLPIGFCFGAMEVTLPAFAEDVANRAWAGALIAIWSAGSALGGLWYGARAWRSGVAERYVRLAWLLPLGYLPLAAAQSLAAMVPLCILAGVTIAPLLTAGNQLVGDVAPAGALTEAFTWPITALVSGLAVGNAAAGAVVEAADWRAAFLVAAAGASLGAMVALAGRRALAAA